MLYFAYGSNLCSARLTARVGPLRVGGRAWLPGHEHRFSKHGRDGTGKGNVEPHPTRLVHGVLYHLTDAQLRTLDAFEGGYRRVECLVLQADGARLHAVTFVALAPGAAPPPSLAYLDHYRRGFLEHDLPRAYAHALLRDAGDERPLGEAMAR